MVVDVVEIFEKSWFGLNLINQTKTNWAWLDPQLHLVSTCFYPVKKTLGNWFASHKGKENRIAIGTSRKKKQIRATSRFSFFQKPTYWNGCRRKPDIYYLGYHKLGPEWEANRPTTKKPMQSHNINWIKLLQMGPSYFLGKAIIKVST